MKRLVFVAALVVCASPLAHARDDASDYLKRGLLLYQNEKYKAAILEFEAGYRIDPRPELLYAMAQAYRLDGQCERAIEKYQAFLDAKPPRRQAEAARANIERCAEEVAGAAVEGKTEQSPPPPQRIEARPVERPAPARAPATGRDAPRDEPVPWYRDRWGVVLLGGGVAALGVGTGLFVASSSDAHSAREAMTYGAYQSRMEAAQRRRTLSVVSLVAGTGLVAGAVYRFVTRDDAPEGGPAVSAWVGDGAGLVVGGRF